MSQIDGSGGAASTEGGAPGDAAAGGNGGTGSAGSAGPLNDSLLTRDHGSGADRPGDGNVNGYRDSQDGNEQDGGPHSLVPESPEDYDLRFDDNISVDQKLLNNFKNEAHRLGIRQGQARKLADFYVKHAGEAAQAVQEAQNAHLAQTKSGWEAEIMSRPEFKREVADARRTLKTFGGPELDPLLKQSMLGSHPAFFDFVVKVGKALSEPDARGAGHGSLREAPLVDRLWPGMK